MDSEPGYRRSASWYKRSLTLKNDFKHTVPFFEGTNFETKVYVNGNFVGEHIGGYLAFEFDITEFISKGDNEVLVRVSNEYNRNLIPSQKADFFLHGGITRDVWLKHYPEIYLTNLAVKTPIVSSQYAGTLLEIDINAKSNKGYKVVSPLYLPSNELIEKKYISLNTNQKYSVEFDTLSNPQLWSPDHPNLYKVNVKLFKNNKLQHELNESIGKLKK